MNMKPEEWSLLVYRIPPQPTRLRLQIWRRLQKMGVVYLQNAVCLLPARPDLVENMEYVAAMIEEMGGTCFLFLAKTALPGADERLHEEFSILADTRLQEIIERLDRVETDLDSAVSPASLERGEEELKRERIAYLRVRRLAYFGSTKEQEVDSRLESLKQALDEMYRSSK